MQIPSENSGTQKTAKLLAEVDLKHRRGSLKTAEPDSEIHFPNKNRGIIMPLN